MRIGLTVRSLPLAIATSRAGDHLPLTRASFNLRQTAAKGVEGAVCVCPLIYAAVGALDRAALGALLPMTGS